MENTSGQGKNATVPAEIDRWNWGAFLLNWIWGIGNNTFIALLMFVPLVSFVMVFILGAKGSAWAWRNKRWDSIEQFKTVQKQWARWSVVVYLLVIAFFVALFFSIMLMIKHSDAFKLAQSKLEASQQIAQLFGTPLSTGLPSGSIETSATSGRAEISFSLQGPKGKGTVYFDATKELGQWKINHFVIEEDKSGQRIDLNP